MKKIYSTAALLCCLSSGVFAQWQLTGNAGTNPATNFIGTTDNKPLVIRVNGAEVMRVKASGRIDITNNFQTTYLGKNAGVANQAAANVFVGYEAGKTNDYGDFNVAVGYNAMHECTGFGDHNVAVGANALYSGVNGQSVFNTALGAEALAGNTFGVSNTATGYSALSSNSGGSFNTANGQWALISNTSGGSNTAVGEWAAGSNTTGNANLALGNRSLFGNKTGNSNIAIGTYAMASSVANSGNIAIGDSALGKYNDGSLTDYMVALGSKALLNNTTGFYNTSVGSRSLTNNTSGFNNTALGLYSLTTVTSGYSNTALGAYANVNAATRYNATAVGYNAIATADNQVMLGSTLVTSVKAAGSFVIYSDGRFKRNIQQNVPGLEFINMLKPVTYNYDIHGLNKKIGAAINNDRNQNEAEEKSIAQKEKKLYTGFVAQDVEKAAEKLNYDFSGVYKPQDDKDVYGLSYADFVVPLVKAVQELSLMNNKKDSAIAALAQQNAALEARLSKIENTLNASSSFNTSSISANINQALLQQNVPNPFKTSAVINYNLPSKYTTAYIAITDKNGSIVKQANISGSGKGQFTVDASSLSAGSYQYSLIIDGKAAASKQMVITK